MHCGALRVGDDKMSKSLGNFLTIRDALKTNDPEVLRYLLVRPHYRSQVAFAPDMVGEARASLARLYTALKDAPAAPAATPIDWEAPAPRRFAEAMDDDFNTAQAVSVLFELAAQANRGDAAAASQMRALGGLLGLLQRDPIEFLRGAAAAGQGGIEESRIEMLIAARAAAKARRDYQESDRIREELLQQGIVLEDGPAGTTWRRR